MIQILPQGDDVYHLVGTGGLPVGWIRGAAIRIGAFATEREAIAGARHGARVLDDYLRGGSDRRAAVTDGAGNGPAGADADPRGTPGRDTCDTHDAHAGVRLVHDGAYEWVVAGRRPLARLMRPRAPRVLDDAVSPVAPDSNEPAPRVPAPGATTRDFALEFVVPAAVAPMTRLTLARVLHRALARDEGLRAADTPADRPSPTPRADLPDRPRSATRVRPPRGTPVPPRSRPSLGEEPDPTDPRPAA